MQNTLFKLKTDFCQNLRTNYFMASVVILLDVIIVLSFERWEFNDNFFNLETLKLTKTFHKILRL